MKLEEYKTLEEKEDAFNMIAGTSSIHYKVDVFFENIDKLHHDNLLSPENPHFAFRGQPEAKYKLYNSAQRYFYENGINELNKKVHEGKDTNEKLRFFITWTTSIITESLKWQGSVIPKILNKLTNNFDHPVLTACSYLRHYGVPTPFLDFSHNPYVALFFALEEICNKPSNNTIDNYFSLYIVDSKLSHICAEHFKTTDFYKTYFRPIECYNLFEIWTNYNSTIFTNLNIINQEGCFISNIIQNDSLETAYKYLICEYLSNIDISEINPITCYNIHKGLIPIIQEKLKEKGITREFIYPDPYSIKEVTDKATIELLKRNN